MASGKDSVCFVQPLEVGRASLYSFATNESGILLQPPTSDTLLELTAINRNLLFHRYLSNCPTLQMYSPEVLGMRFTPDNAERVIRRYNTCAQPNRPTVKAGQYSLYRSGLGLQFGITRARLAGNDAGTSSSGAVTTWGKSAGLSWTSIQSSGVQVEFSGAYTHLPLRSRPYTGYTNQGLLVEQRNVSSTHLLSLGLSAGKRLGRPNVPSFYLGAGVGSTFLLRDKTQTQQRPAGSNAPFQTVEEYRAGGEAFLPYLQATAGLHVPLGTSQEIRLAANYQKYVFEPVTFLGLQLTYYRFWK